MLYSYYFYSLEYFRIFLTFLFIYFFFCTYVILFLRTFFLLFSYFFLFITFVLLFLSYREPFICLLVFCYISDLWNCSLFFIVSFLIVRTFLFVEICSCCFGCVDGLLFITDLSFIIYAVFSSMSVWTHWASNIRTSYDQHDRCLYSLIICALRASVYSIAGVPEEDGRAIFFSDYALRAWYYFDWLCGLYLLPEEDRLLAVEGPHLPVYLVLHELGSTTVVAQDQLPEDHH